MSCLASAAKMSLPMALLRQAREERREAQRRLLDVVDHFRQAHQVDGAVDPVQAALVEVELVEQELRQFLRAVARHFQPHRGAELAAHQLALQGLAQVLDFVLVDPQVAVARDAELRIGDHFAPGEQVRDMRVDDGGQQTEGHAVGNLVRQLDHARQHARRLDDGDRRAAAEGVLAAQRDDEIEALVNYLRKRVGRVQADRRQQRAHFAVEIILDPGALRLVAVLVAQQVHARRAQGRQHVVIEDLVLLFHQRMAFLVDALQIGRQGRVAGQGAADAAGRQQAGHAHFEELIHVAADDAQIAQAFEQGNIRIFGLRHDAPVEGQLRQFPVKQDARFGHFRVQFRFHILLTLQIVNSSRIRAR